MIEPFLLQNPISFGSIHAACRRVPAAGARRSLVAGPPASDVDFGQQEAQVGAMATWVLNKLNRGVEVMFDRPDEDEDESFSKCPLFRLIGCIYFHLHPGPHARSTIDLSCTQHTPPARVLRIPPT